MRAHEMTGAHRQVKGKTIDALTQCIAECFDCAESCTSCADACQRGDQSADQGAELVRQPTSFIQLCLDCADICTATGRVVARRSGSNEAVVHQMLRACEAACRRCAEECERHSGHQAHCRRCAEACRACERACHEAATSIRH